MPSQQATTGPALMEGVEWMNTVVVKIAEGGLNFYFSFSFSIYFLFLELGLGLSDKDHVVT